MKHLIGRQTLSIDFNGSAAAAMAFQQQLTPMVHDRLMPAIAQIFDEISDDTETIVIDKLEIDAGSIAAGEMHDELPRIVALRIKQLLRNNSPLPAAPAASESAEGLRSHTPLQQFTRILAYYLQTGRFPWNFAFNTATGAEADLLRLLGQSGTRAETAAALGQLKPVLKQSVPSERLFSTFSEIFISKVIEVLHPEVFRLIQKLLSSPELAGLKSARASKPAILRAAFRLTTVGPPYNEDKLLEIYRNEIRPKPIDPDPIKKAPKLRNKAKEPHSDTPELRVNRPDTTLTIHDLQGIPVVNAGIVLLHPFLPALFSVPGIAQKKDAIDAGLALPLLHYLATGSSNVAEYDLVLAKVLCGIPVEMPAFNLIKPDSKARAEADALLLSVIEHWSALRNTSPNGLRGNFLTRPGALFALESGDWLLRVEHRSYDILLGKLPWSIGLIKLPWMPGFIQTEWIS